MVIIVPAERSLMMRLEKLKVSRLVEVITDVGMIV
jgi:hypothetical protein